MPDVVTWLTCNLGGVDGHRRGGMVDRPRGRPRDLRHGGMSSDGERARGHRMLGMCDWPRDRLRGVWHGCGVCSCVIVTFPSVRGSACGHSLVSVERFRLPRGRPRG